MQEYTVQFNIRTYVRMLITQCCNLYSFFNIPICSEMVDSSGCTPHMLKLTRNSCSRVFQDSTLCYIDVEYTLCYIDVEYMLCYINDEYTLCYINVEYTLCYIDDEYTLCCMNVEYTHAHTSYRCSVCSQRYS